MSAIVKLAPVLPKDSETNGLDHIKDALVDTPDRLRYAVVAFRVRNVNTVIDTGVRIPTIEIERAEYVGDTSNVPSSVIDAFMEAAQDRTGAEPLPFDQTDPAGITVEPDEDRDDPFFPDEEGVDQ